MSSLSIVQFPVYLSRFFLAVVLFLILVIIRSGVAHPKGRILLFLSGFLVGVLCVWFSEKDSFWIIYILPFVSAWVVTILGWEVIQTRFHAMHRPQVALWLGVYLAAMCLVVQVLIGPVYQGLTLRDWLEKPYTIDATENAKQVVALLQMKQAALPRLVRLLQREDGKLESQIWSWIDEHVRKTDRNLRGSHEAALTGFRILGKSASSVIPRLEPMLYRQETVERAAEALAYMGDASLEVRLKAIEKGPVSCRNIIVESLGYSRLSAAAENRLFDLMKSPDPVLRAAAVRVLIYRASNQERLLRELKDGLKDPSEDVLLMVYRGLAKALHQDDTVLYQTFEKLADPKVGSGLRASAFHYLLRTDSQRVARWIEQSVKEGRHNQLDIVLTAWLQFSSHARARKDLKELGDLNRLNDWMKTEYSSGYLKNRYRLVYQSEFGVSPF